VRCSVLQCAAEFCKFVAETTPGVHSVLQNGADVLQCVAMCCRELYFCSGVYCWCAQCVAGVVQVCCSALQCFTVCCSVRQRVVILWRRLLLVCTMCCKCVARVLQCVAAFCSLCSALCSVLQCAAECREFVTESAPGAHNVSNVCCSVLQSSAVCRSVLQCAGSALQCVAVFCSGLKFYGGVCSWCAQYVADVFQMYCNALQCVAVLYSSSQRIAVRCRGL